MTVYTAIPNGDIDQDSPVTQPLLTALRDNLLAGLEGDTTAPVNQATWHPYNKVTVGDTNTGLIYSFPVNGAVASIVTPDFADGYEYALIFEDLRSTVVSQTLRFEFYRETSAAYSGADSPTGASLTTASGLFGQIELLRVRQTRRVQVSNAFFLNNPSNNQVPQAANIFYVSHTTAQKILRVRLSSSGGNITGSGSAGQIYMFRRKDIA